MTEVVEQDDATPEDTNNITQFLRDGMPAEDACLQEGSLYNRRIFNGWMKQPSACCAAASVAGAFNALACVRRGNDGALTHADILQVYESIFSDIITKHKSAYERRLGGALDDFLITIGQELQSVGREIGGSKGANATTASVLNIIKKLAITRAATRQKVPAATEEESAELTIPNIPPESAVRDALDCFVELFEGEGIILLPDIPSDEANADGNEDNQGEGEKDQEYDDNGNEENEGNEGEEEDANVLVNPTPGKIRASKKGIKKDSSVWEWRKDLMKIIQNMAGLKKLRAARPSTAAVGNWGILQVVDRLSEWTSLGTTLKARLYMGKKRLTSVKIDVSLSRKDDEKVVTSQWDHLRSTFGLPNTVILFHLKNHYALIFALREWVSTDTSTDTKDGVTTGTVNVLVCKRQILTARKGQRPTAWIDFDEARETMLNWEGYKIMALTYTGASPLNVIDINTSKLIIPEEYKESLQK